MTVAEALTQQTMPKIGDVVAGKYEVERVIGEGGMGAVFSATHKLTGKRVALKWMLPGLARAEEAMQRFMREAQAAGRINHPNVVDVYDVGQHDDSFFLVMELLQGEPLTAAIERRDLSYGQMLDLLLPAMRGLAAAHRQGVVHRDLKPDNIFLCRDDDAHELVPKVLDFGISKLANKEAELHPRITKTGAIVGTPYYMSPEQIRGSDDVDKRADVYAFGVILYEALTGQVPFDATTYGALVLQIATSIPKDPSQLAPQLPAALSKIVLRAMAREPGDRFPDMESLGTALEPFAFSVSFRGDRRDPTGRQRATVAQGSAIDSLEIPAAVAHGAAALSSSLGTNNTLPAPPLGARTTPMSSEAPALPRKRIGVQLALLAGVLVLGGALTWLLTRPAAVRDAAAHTVVPLARPPTNQTQPSAAVAADATAVVDMADKPLAPPPEPVPSAIVAPTPSASPVTSTNAVTDGPAREHKHNTRAHAATTSGAQKRGRSGTLTVDDF